MRKPKQLKGRYELREMLGRGGMGVVYRAYDRVLKCEVAVKTIRDAPDPGALQLFYRECEVLVALNHPNIVQILDLGEFEDEGESKPYFVMPMLPGTSLDKLIRGSGVQLTVQRGVEILSQVCRGLHAAHERGLVHRDLKPGNVFVMPDYSVVIIDFGVAHVISATTTGLKGTLLYMAPELIEGKPPSSLSDIFALGVVAYEVFTRRRPFERPTEQEIIEAIQREIPPPVSDLTPAVNQAISRVVHKAMAKQPWHRFSTAREFAECLEKAHRGQPIEYFDAVRIQPRIQRAKSAFEGGDFQFALEIVSELEAEGHLDPDLSLLHRQVDIAVRQKRIQQLLDSARTRLEGEEYPLAMQKVQEVLEMEPDNAEALGLKSRIEGTRSERQIEGWFRLARQHIDNNTFGHAREALQNVLQIRPQDTHAIGLLAEVDRREQEYLRIRQKKEELYHAAVEAYQIGEISAAIAKLEQVLDLDRQAPDSSHPERGTAYQNFYNQVRSEHEAIRSSYAEARKHLDDQNFAKALSVCDQYLRKYPGHALFQALKFDVEVQQRVQLSAYIAEIDRRVETEPDLERKVSILTEALERFPEEPHFERLLRLTRERLDLVNAIMAKARYLEERGHFSDALAQWEILQTIHVQSPGLHHEIDRVTKRRDQKTRMEAKGRWVQQIEGHLQAAEYAGALELSRGALGEFPEDRELLELQKLACQGEERHAEAQRLLAQGEQLFVQGSFDEGIEALRKAHQLDEGNPVIRAALLNKLTARAQSLLDKDWRAAEPLIQRAFELEPGHAAANSVRILLEDRRREAFVDQSVAEVRQLQTADDLKGALARVTEALSFYPDEARLIQLHSTLKNAYLESERAQSRRRDFEELSGLANGIEFVSDPADVQSVLELMRTICGRHPGEPEFQSVVEEVERRVEISTKRRQAAAAAAAEQIPPAPSGPPEALVPRTPPAFTPPSGAPLSSAGAIDATRMMGRVGGEPAPSGSLGASPSPPQPEPWVPPAVKSPEVTPPASAAQPDPVARPGNSQRVRRPKPWRGIPARPAILVPVALLALAACVTAWMVLRPRPRVEVSFEVRTTPPGASIQIDGKPLGTSNSPIRLAAGDYQLQVVMEGYQAETVPLTLKPDSPPPPIDLILRPLPQKMRLFTDLRSGTVWLDDAAVGALARDGQLLLDIDTPGQHTLKIESGSNWASFVFTTAPGTLPVVAKPEVSRGLDAVVISNLGDRGFVHSTYGEVRALIGERDTGRLGSNGLELRNLTTGTYELSLGEGEQLWSASVEAGPEPTITAFLRSGDNDGRRREIVKPVLPVVRLMNDADWEKPWKREGDWFMCEGGGFMLYRVTPTTGTFQFTLRPKDVINPFASPKVRWVLDYRNERNYVLFEMDKRSYSCFEYREGNRNVRVNKKRHGLSGGYYSLKMDVEPNRVVLHVTRDNKSYDVLDDWRPPDRAFTNGRFGFYVPDGAPMWLAHFRFVQPSTTR